MRLILTTLVLLSAVSFFANASTLYDAARERSIPLQVSYPINSTSCTANTKCPVAFLSAGYGVAHTDYQFIARTFNQAGFLVVAIGHELDTDPPLSTTGNLYLTRAENWQRGSTTLNFVQATLSTTMPEYDFSKLTLIGHSNGGDISAWFAKRQPENVAALITLDHRRVPLPKTNAIKVFSIRASDFPADAGVLPSPSEQTQYNSCVLTINNAKHNDIADFGPDWLKQTITQLLQGYLVNKPCNERNE